MSTNLLSTHGSRVAAVSTIVGIVAILVVIGQLTSAAGIASETASDRSSNTNTRSKLAATLTETKSITSKNERVTRDLQAATNAPAYQRFVAAKSAADAAQRQVTVLKESVAGLRTKIAELATPADTAYLEATATDQITCARWLNSTSTAREAVFPESSLLLDGDCRELSRTDRQQVTILDTNTAGTTEFLNDSKPLMDARLSSTKTGGWSYLTAMDLEIAEMGKCADEGVSDIQARMSCAHARMPAEALAALE